MFNSRSLSKLSVSLRSLCVLALFVASTQSFAQPSGDLGVGVVIGEPTALSAKYKVSQDHAFDFGFGYSWGQSVQFFSDYLFLYPGMFTTSSKEHLSFTPYIGVGGSLALYDTGHRKNIGSTDASFSLALRIPLGAALPIPKSPIEVFAELVPLIYVVPGIDLGLNGGLGIRVFF